MCFQKFLNLFPVRWYVLHTFVDAFYGCYKDGTEPGTRDYRWFVSLLFILRFLQFLLYFLPVKIIYNHLITVIVVLYTTLFATLQPFKSSVSHFNAIHILFFQALSIFSLTSLGISISSLQEPNLVFLFYIIGIFISLVPCLYFLSSIAYWVYSCRRFGLALVQRLRAWRGGYDNLTQENDQLPDRILNSGEYPRENYLADIIST